MIAKDLKKKYDIVFWAHGHNEIERYLPLIVSLQKKQIKVLLFFQGFNSVYGLSEVEKKIIAEFSIETMDYSYFFKDNLMFSLLTVFSGVFKMVGLGRKYSFFIRDLFKHRIDENLIERVLSELAPKISFFDTLSLVKYADHPYGSYYLSKISKEKGIKRFAVCHGSTPYTMDSRISRKKDFDRYYVSNKCEKKRCIDYDVKEDVTILDFGDPRFDRKWKDVINDIFTSNILAKMGSVKNKNSVNIIYVCPNLEMLKKEDAKYLNLDKVIKAIKNIGNTNLLIKPHPRYRSEKMIKSIMKANKFDDYIILDNDPLICYLDSVDFVVSMLTSAIYDLLPEGSKKIIIYDDFSEFHEIKNLFKDDFIFFNKIEDLEGYVKYYKENGTISNMKELDFNKIEQFCNKWIAGGDSPLRTVEKITEDVIDQIQNCI